MVKLTEPAILAQLPAANARGKEQRRLGLHASSVVFDRKRRRFVLELTNGVSLGIPVAALEALHGATLAQLAQIELTPSGAGLRIDALDADFSVPGIVQAIVGKDIAVRAFAQAGGKSTSTAKAQAARRNGAKGGRPRVNRV